jgi:hypothetical protein
VSQLSKEGAVGWFAALVVWCRKTIKNGRNGLFVRSEAKEGRLASAAGRSMLSHDAGSVQRGTVIETRLVGLHVCSLPSQLLANAAIAASCVAS